MLIYQQNQTLAFLTQMQGKLLQSIGKRMEKTETFDRETKKTFWKHLPDPRGTATYVQRPTESFRLFFTDVTVDNIVD